MTCSATSGIPRTDTGSWTRTDGRLQPSHPFLGRQQLAVDLFRPLLVREEAAARDRDRADVGRHLLAPDCGHTEYLPNQREVLAPERQNRAADPGALACLVPRHVLPAGAIIAHRPADRTGLAASAYVGGDSPRAQRLGVVAPARSGPHALDQPIALPAVDERGDQPGGH